MSRFERRLIPALALSLTLFLSACARSTTSAAEKPVAAQPDPVPQSRTPNDVGRFIAGLPGTAGSPFAALEATDAWKQHRSSLDAAWHKAESPLMSGLVEFQKAELNDEALRTAPLFYPFGGPDALTVTLCFPHSPVYVMVALEPPGTLPTLKQFERKDAPKYLAEIRETVASELGKSFFITREMDKQFRGQVTDGLLLPILHLLVRTHNTILGFRYVRIDDQGQVVDRTADYESPNRNGNKGFELEFRSDADQSVHQLYYFSVNLADNRLKDNQPFLSYVASLKGSTTMLKATSYMTHQKEFSVIREQMLAVSGAILQDDSGIPYKYFQPDAWKVQLYGDYIRPYGSFRWLEQPDLRKAYATGAKPLSLHLGYGYLRITSNLLLARRMDPAPAIARR